MTLMPSSPQFPHLENMTKNSIFPPSHPMPKMRNKIIGFFNYICSMLLSFFFVAYRRDMRCVYACVFLRECTLLRGSKLHTGMLIEHSMYPRKIYINARKSALLIVCVVKSAPQKTRLFICPMLTKRFFIPLKYGMVFS